MDGGTGNDRLIVDWHDTTGGVGNSAGVSSDPNGNNGAYGDNTGRSVGFSHIDDLTVLTGSGNDNFTTGTGNDIISLGAGDNSVNTQTGLASVDGGDGNDTWQADLSAATAGIHLDLTSATPQTYSLTLGGDVGTIQNVEALNLKTGSGDDTIVTTEHGLNDNLTTGAGNDTIRCSTATTRWTAAPATTT